MSVDERMKLLEAWKCPVPHGILERKMYAQDFSYVRCEALVGIGTETRECGEEYRLDVDA